MVILKTFNKSHKAILIYLNDPILWRIEDEINNGWE